MCLPIHRVSKYQAPLFAKNRSNDRTSGLRDQTLLEVLDNKLIEKVQFQLAD